MSYVMDKKLDRTFSNDIKLGIVFDEKAPDTPLFLKEEKKPLKPKINSNDSVKKDKKIWKKINKLYDQKVANLNYCEHKIWDSDYEIWESDTEEIKKLVAEEKKKAVSTKKVLNKLHRRLNNRNSESSESD